MIRYAFLLAAAALAVPNPAVADDAQPGLTIKAGEHWIFKLRDGQPVDARPAGADDKPAAGEFRVDLESVNGTMMVVVNNTDKFYNYRAFMMRKPGEKGQRTGVCTLMSGGRTAFEQWMQNIPVIRISDFTEAKEGRMVCA